MLRLGEHDQKRNQPPAPSSHVAHEDLGGKWSWRNGNTDLHSPQGGAGPRHVPPLGPQHWNTCMVYPCLAVTGPPWPPTEPQIKKLGTKN